MFPPIYSIVVTTSQKPFATFTRSIRELRKRPLKLRFDYELALHPPVADSAKVAAMKRVGSWPARLKLDYDWSPLLDLEAIFVGTEDQTRITFLPRPVGIQIDLEAVRLI
jgi:hypothetical protein